MSEKTRAEDERLKEELRHADMEKFKRVIKPLLSRKPKSRRLRQGKTPPEAPPRRRAQYPGGPRARAA